LQQTKVIVNHNLDPTDSTRHMVLHHFLEYGKFLVMVKCPKIDVISDMI